MAVTADTTILKDGTAIVWSAEFRIDGKNAVLLWIRARTPDDEFSDRWLVRETIVDAIDGDEVTGAIRALIDHEIEAKYAERSLGSRHR